MSTNYYTGHLLVAPPKMMDKRFSNTVVYIVNHTAAGAWGLVVNKPGNLTNKDLLGQIGIDLDLVGIAHAGGPMNTNSIHFLHTPEIVSAGTFPGNIYASGDMEFIQRLQVGPTPKQFRMFVGSCSWAPGQLELEVMGESPWRPEYSWLTVPATPELVFYGDEMQQWQQAVDACATNVIKDWMA